VTEQGCEAHTVPIMNDAAEVPEEAAKRSAKREAGDDGDHGA
jgi:hypothetical protein